MLPQRLGLDLPQPVILSALVLGLGGSFAGYRLLFPAGPLIVATGLGIDSSALFVTGLVLRGPVHSAVPALDFVTHPKGALLVAAAAPCTWQSSDPGA